MMMMVMMVIMMTIKYYYDVWHRMCILVFSVCSRVIAMADNYNDDDDEDYYYFIVIFNTFEKAKKKLTIQFDIRVLVYL